MIFTPARRVNQALTASLEKRALQWMAQRAPLWLSSDQLTLLGLGAQIGSGGQLCLVALQPLRCLVYLVMRFSW